jgi:hypothetical protein
LQGEGGRALIDTGDETCEAPWPWLANLEALPLAFDVLLSPTDEILAEVNWLNFIEGEEGATKTLSS